LLPKVLINRSVNQFKRVVNKTCFNAINIYCLSALQATQTPQFQFGTKHLYTYYTRLSDKPQSIVPREIVYAEPAGSGAERANALLDETICQWNEESLNRIREYITGSLLSKNAAPALLEGAGWRVAHGPEIAPDMPAAEQANYGEYADFEGWTGKEEWLQLNMPGMLN
jgi:hypothetical protein